MSRLFWALLLAVFALSVSPLNACVGKTLHIGIIDNPTEQLLAELTSQLITARTGTTVKIDRFKGQQELYNAVKKGEIGLVIESTDRAMEMIGKPRETPAKAALETARSEYRKSLNMIWLEPYGQVQGGQQTVAPVITSDILNSLPALPKLLQKLSGITADAAYARMLKARGDDGGKKIARDFLKNRKLI